MKKIIQLTLIIEIMILSNHNAFAQVTTPANTGAATDYVGWDATQNFPLNIRHNRTGQPINFWTFNFQRMTIVDGGAAFNAGYIGMGNNLPVGFTPLDRLHLFQTTGTNYIRFSQNSTALNGFQIGILNNGNADIKQTENKTLSLWTNNINRIRIDANGLVNVLNTSAIPTLMNVAGPINSNSPLPNASVDKTIVYGYTPVTGTPAAGSDDGYRIKFNRYFQGVIDRDALVFEKTDYNLADPDGAIAFTNTGSDGVEELSIMIVGNGRTGIGHGFTMASATARPENRLEIESDLAVDPSRSGLRFRNLIASSPTLPGNGKMLTVDADGDVILVPATGGGSVISGADNGTSLDASTGSTVQLGNDVGLTSAQLLNDREIPMNNFNLFFTDPASPAANTNRVQMGSYTGLPYNIFSKLSSFNGENSSNLFRIGGFFTTTSSLNFTGIPLQFNPFYFGNISANYKVGSASIAMDNTSSVGRYVGVTGGAYSTISQNNVGTSGKAYGSSQTNFGIYGLAGGNDLAAFNYGVSGVANGLGTNYGVYGSAFTGTLNRAGYFAGDVEYTGALISSDQIFKTDVETIKSGTEILKRLKPLTYKMDIVNYPQFNFENVRQYGFIAQDVEFILPELVHDSKSPADLDSLGNIVHPSISYKSLNYNALIPITVQAVNELGAKIEKSTLSDQSIKTNVQNLSGSLAKIRQMRGVTYKWSSPAQSNMELDSLEHIGFIAQEISAIEPLLTFVDDSSLMHVNYDRVVPVLVESIKDLDAQVQERDSIIAELKLKDSLLDVRMTALENALNSCCTSNHSMQQNNNSSNSIGSQGVNLKDEQSIVLDQNSPNPFSEQTTITYFLPESAAKAQMLFYNAQGKLIQSLDLVNKGKASVNVFAQDLSNGIYTYTLVVDGKVIETKKMIKQQ